MVPPANRSDGTADAPVGWQARTRRRRLPEKQYALLDRSSGPGRLSCGVADQDEEKKLPAAAVEASKLSWEQEEQVAVTYCATALLLRPIMLLDSAIWRVGV